MKLRTLEEPVNSCQFSYIFFTYTFFQVTLFQFCLSYIYRFRSKNRKAIRTLSGGIKEEDVHQHEDIIYCNEGILITDGVCIYYFLKK